MKVLCLLGIIVALSTLGVKADDDLPTPCRARRLPCGNQDYVCATEESYQSSLYGPQLGCPEVFNASATPPPGECILVNGSCRYSTDLLNCTTWLPECRYEYQCGTFEAYTNYLTESPAPCPFINDVPPPNLTCIQINESCQWYDPCRTWQGFCDGPWNCGTTSDYWAFVHGPQPICAVPPPGFVEPIPPGECIVQDGQCSWSNCRSWLNWCQTWWECGTEYQYLQYQSLPPPACPFPGENYQPPIEPGECKFDVAAGSCQYVVNTTCPEGKVYQDCGTACPLTCDNYNNPPFACTLQCVQGCFCPTGQVEKGDECVEPPQCSAVTCPEGKEYSDCGTACPLTCDNYNGPPPDYACSIECFEGCFCPEGLVQHGETCVDPSNCPPGPCALVFCAPGYHCIVSEITGEAICDPSCDDLNGGCPANKICRITEIECRNQPCDNYRLISCQYPVSDLCQPDMDRCPSNAHCLTFNATQDKTCLQSCFLDNGGCAQDQVCVTSPPDEDCTTLAQPCSSVGCVDIADLKGGCPPGLEYTECGEACQVTCDNYQVSPLVCPAVCIPGCACPEHLARYRDRCVDPLECATLLRNPPPNNPVPQLEGNTVLIQLILSGMNSEEFTSQQQEVVAAVSMLLRQNGYLFVSVNVHAVVEEDKNLQVVLQFASDEMYPERLDENRIAALIANGRDTISVDVAKVSVVEDNDGDDDDDDDDDDGLPVGAIAGIVIGALLFSTGTIVVIALIVYCFISQRKPTTKNTVTSASGSVAVHPTSYSKLQEIASLENEYEES